MKQGRQQGVLCCGVWLKIRVGFGAAPTTHPSAEEKARSTGCATARRRAGAAVGRAVYAASCQSDGPQGARRHWVVVVRGGGGACGQLMSTYSRSSAPSHPVTPSCLIYHA